MPRRAIAARTKECCFTLQHEKLSFVQQIRGTWAGQSSEAQLDVLTAVSGSGPAYFFLLAEHLASAAMELGLEPETARRLAVDTLRGAGALLNLGSSLAAERSAVTSRGGTTEAAIRVFEQRGLDLIVRSAVEAATCRSREIAMQSASQ